jgi:hypothetical protein
MMTDSASPAGPAAPRLRWSLRPVTVAERMLLLQAGAHAQAHDLLAYYGAMLGLARLRLVDETDLAAVLNLPVAEFGEAMADMTRTMDRAAALYALGQELGDLSLDPAAPPPAPPAPDAAAASDTPAGDPGGPDASL